MNWNEIGVFKNKAAENSTLKKSTYLQIIDEKRVNFKENGKCTNKKRKVW